MRFSDSTSGGGSSPWMDRLGGAAAGAGGLAAVQALQHAKTRANWALGISLGLAGITLINSGALLADQNNAQAIAIAANGLTFTDAGATGAQVAALRAQFVALCNVVAKLAYDANIWSFFQSAPVAQPTTISTAAIAAVSATASTNNNILVLAIVGIGIAALALS